MAFDTAATTFVTGAAGFIGTELVKELTDRGHHVLGLAESADEATRLRRIGATAVMGDLLVPGSWQDEAGADWVFHLPPYQSYPLHLTQRRAAAIASARVLMDASQAGAELLALHLLERPLPDYAGAFHPGRFDDPAYQQVLATLDPRAGQL